MHEASLIASVLDKAGAAMREHRAERIHRITLRVGALSCAAPDALRFAFDALTQTGPAAGAVLEIETCPAILRCSGCGREFEAEGFLDLCPSCGGWHTEVRRGRELEVRSIEVS